MLVPKVGSKRLGFKVLSFGHNRTFGKGHTKLKGRVKLIRAGDGSTKVTAGEARAQQQTAVIHICMPSNLSRERILLTKNKGRPAMGNSCRDDRGKRAPLRQPTLGLDPATAECPL